MEIIEAKSLKPFVEKTCDGVGAALVTGNSDMFKEALEKQEAMEDKENRINKLESGLGGFLAWNMLKRGQRCWKKERGSWINRDAQFFYFTKDKEYKSFGRYFSWFYIY